MFKYINSRSFIGYLHSTYSPSSLFQERRLLYQSTSKALQSNRFMDKIVEMNPNINKSQISAYCGYDPTASSLHLGNLVSIIMMARMEVLLGLRPIFVLGGATGQIGDPSGKKNQRSLLEQNQVSENLSKINNQIKSVYKNIYNSMLKKSDQYNVRLSNTQTKAIYVNNHQFYNQMPVLNFLRDVGKNISMSALLSKQHIATRLQSQSGISYTQFSYTILQAYDFYVLNKKYNCYLQFGGSDQWGNIVNGTTLLRKLSNNERQAYGITMPLLVTKTGQKFGKSEGNALFLDKKLTPTSKIYDYLYNTTDQQVEKLLYIFTLYTSQQINEILHLHLQNKEMRLAQKKLAQSVTQFLGDYKNVKEQLLKLSENELENLSVQQMYDYYENLPQQMKFQQNRKCESIQSLPDLLVKLRITSTKKQARRQIEGQGIYLNNSKIPKQYISQSITGVLQKHILKNGYMAIRRGKKKIYLVRFS